MPSRIDIMRAQAAMQAAQQPQGDSKDRAYDEVMRQLAAGPGGGQRDQLRAAMVQNLLGGIDAEEAGDREMQMAQMRGRQALAEIGAEGDMRFNNAERSAQAQQEILAEDPEHQVSLQNAESVAKQNALTEMTQNFETDPTNAREGWGDWGLNSGVIPQAARHISNVVPWLLNRGSDVLETIGGTDWGDPVPYFDTSQAIRYRRDELRKRYAQYAAENPGMAGKFTENEAVNRLIQNPANY